MDEDLVNFAKHELERLKLPYDMLYEIEELFVNFSRDKHKSVSHLDKEKVMKCIIWAVARKRGHYILFTEICDGLDRKTMASIVNKLREYLGYPKYLNFNSMGYVERVGQLLDLQYKDLEKIFNNLCRETPISILAKFNEYLNIDFDKLLEIRPTLTKQQMELYKKNK